MFPIFDACSFDYAMNRGINKPCVVRALREGEEAEFVLKMNAGFRNHVAGPVHELIASLLASKFGLLTPAPAFIRVSPDFPAIIPMQARDRAELAEQSIGINFGSRYLSPDWKTWPQARRVPDNQRSMASEIFAFDALIQNCDRGFDNPNLLFRGDEIAVLDHEQAFAFLSQIPAEGLPWRGETLHYLQFHVFFSSLKGSNFSLQKFLTNLNSLEDNFLQSLLQEIPEEWRARSDLPRILEYLGRVRLNGEAFVDQIRSVLL